MRRSMLLVMLIVASNIASAHMMNGSMGRGAQQPSTQDDSNKTTTGQKGYALTQTYCTGCHQPPNPVQHTPQQWPQVIERMQRYMQQQRRRLPDSSEVKLILQYLDNSQTDKR